MKTAPDFNGVTVQEEARRGGWSPSNGYYTVRTFKGTEAEITTLVPGLVAQGYEYDFIEGPLWTLVVKTPQNTDGNGDPLPEVPIPVFELVSQRVDKNLLESDCPYVTSLGTDTIQKIRQSIRDDSGPTFLTSSFASPTEKLQAAELYIHLMNGVETFTIYVPVLRKTFTVSNQYIVNETMTVNRVYSTNTLISYENIPAMMQNILPSSGTTSNIIPNPLGLTATINVVANWGWLKGSPQYQQIGPSQFQVTVDYEYNLWSQNIYGGLL